MTAPLSGSSLRVDWTRDWDRRSLASVEARRVLEQAGQAAVSRAQALAPVGQGDYRDSITSIVDSAEGAYRLVVYATDFKANWIERGAVSPTYTTPAQHPIQRGVESTGVKVTSGE